MEVAVGNDLGVALVGGIGVDVGHVAGELFAVNGEGGGVEDMQLAGSHGGGGSLDGLSGALGGNRLVQVGQRDSAGSVVAAPVGRDLGAVGNRVNDVGKVGSPVDAGGDDVGVGAGSDGGAVVSNVGDVVGLAGGGSAKRVGVLADEDAAVVDQLLRSLGLKGEVAPGAGEGDFHRGFGTMERAPRKKEV